MMMNTESNQSNQIKKSIEISSGIKGNLLSYGSVNLTLTLELFENDFIQNNIDWKKLRNLSSLNFIKENSNLWERIKLSSTDQNMQLLLHMNKILKEKVRIKHICFRKMKYKESQLKFKDFLENIINLNGLYLDSHSICKCQLSVQLRLRYNGKRKLFILCGEKTPLEDDADEDDTIEGREEDNVMLEEGANDEQYQEAENENEPEEEPYEIDEKKNDKEYNPFINMPKTVNNFNEFFYLYFNYSDFTSGVFSGSITIEHLYKYFIYLKKNSKVRTILNLLVV